MTNQQILERAIQKAIDGGWRPHDYAEMWEFSTSPWLSVVFFQSENPDRRFESKWALEELIFNHDFAKALWGETATITMDNRPALPPMEPKDAEYESLTGDYFMSTHKLAVRQLLWRYHLQQMVIADDPTKYLGENI